MFSQSRDTELCLPGPALHYCRPWFVEQMDKWLALGHLGGEVQVEENLSRVFRCSGVIINLDNQLDRI